jgi:hypothetical protein
MLEMKLSVFVFVFVAAYVTANEPDYANGNFDVPSVPKREILRCMGNFYNTSIITSVSSPSDFLAVFLSQQPISSMFSLIQHTKNPLLMFLSLLQCAKRWWMKWK